MKCKTIISVGAIVSIAVLALTIAFWSYASQPTCPTTDVVLQPLESMQTSDAYGETVVRFQPVSLSQLRQVANSTGQLISYGWIANLGYNAFYVSGTDPYNPTVQVIYLYKCP